MRAKEQLLEVLHTLGIRYQAFEHEPLFTCQEAEKVNVPGERCKSLFLKDSKKRYWLIVACAGTTINLKALSKELQAPGLRFAQAEQLLHYLGVLPGSVTPFGLINDSLHEVEVVVDNNLLRHPLVGFHPLKNDATLVLAPQDILRFIQTYGNTYRILDFQF